MKEFESRWYCWWTAWVGSEGSARENTIHIPVRMISEQRGYTGTWKDESRRSSISIWHGGGKVGPFNTDAVNEHQEFLGREIEVQVFAEFACSARLVEMASEARC